jgi:hypothetical protein
MRLRCGLPKLVPKILYAFCFNEKQATTMKTQLHFIKTGIRTEHSTLVMRASNPSPGRMLPDVSRQSFSQERIRLRCGLPKLVPKILYAFSFNEKLVTTTIMKTRHRFTQTWIHSEHSSLVMRAIHSSPGRLFPYVSSQSFGHERMRLRCRLPKLVSKCCNHSSLMSN